MSPIGYTTPYRSPGTVAKDEDRLTRWSRNKEVNSVTSTIDRDQASVSWMVRCRRRQQYLRCLWQNSPVGRCWRQGGEQELLHRAMGFSALGLVTLVPLLIVVSAAVPFPHRGFALWIVDGMGLSGAPSQAVEHLFAAPKKVLSATSALSVVVLALFGVSFAASVQTGYEKVWHLPAGPWHSIWRRAVWLAVLTAYLFVEAQSGTVLRHGGVESAIRIVLTLLFGVLFFWWAQRFLLGGRISWRGLLPGAVATMAGLVGLRAFSTLVFSPLIITNAISYGSVGTVLMVQSWLIGVGFVVFGGALFGRQFHRPHPYLQPPTDMDGKTME